jgi:hypothetical protein
MDREEEKERIQRNMVVVNGYLADYFDVVGSAERPPFEVVFKVKHRPTAEYMRLIVPMTTLSDNESSVLAQRLRSDDVAGQLVKMRNFTWRDAQVQNESAA